MSRTVLQRIIRGRLTFTPRSDGKGYDFSGPTRFDRLFTGVTCTPAPAWIAAGDRRGLEGTTPEDTFDGDYGRLLDRAYEKSKKVANAKGVEVLASPRRYPSLCLDAELRIASVMTNRGNARVGMSLAGQ